jgi:hypothetical protein
MVECGGALIEAARMRRVPETEPLVVEVVAELVAECAEKRTERGDLPANGCPHPDADQFLLRMVVPEKLGSPTALADPEWAGGENPNLRAANSVEVGCSD